MLVFWDKSTLGLVSAFKELDSGNLCTAATKTKPLTSEEQCLNASVALGLVYGQAWSGPGQFPGCLHANDGRDQVFWNTSPSPSETANVPEYGAICSVVSGKSLKSGSKRLDKCTNSSAAAAQTNILNAEPTPSNHRLIWRLVSSLHLSA